MIVFDDTTPKRDKVEYYVGRSLPFVTTFGSIVLALIFGSH